VISSNNQSKYRKNRCKLDTPKPLVSSYRFFNLW